MLEDLETRDLFALDIVFNYTFDTSNFFDTPAKKALLDLAATTYESRIIDGLGAILPDGVTNNWNQVIANPATGAQIDGSTVPSLHNVSVATNAIIVYVGAHDLPGSTLGQGGFGGYSVSGTQDFVNAVQFRGQSGVGTTDFAPWGGSIAFDSNTSWFFSTSIAGITNTQSDFLSVAIHELGHVLGFGTSDSFAADRSGLNFTGVNARNRYDGAGGSIPLNDTGHWAEGTKDGGFEASMDPTVTNGTRKTFTELDFGALVDLGWTLTNHTPVLDNSGSPILTSIAEDTNNNPGTLVSSLITSGGSSLVTDADAFAMQGIAVTAVDNTNGVWQFTINNGTLWTPFNSPTATTAMLLSNDPATKVRFVPTSNYSGTVSGGITYKAWDQTAGNAGVSANTTGGGATSAFSTATETASITVTAVNDAPTNITLSNATVNENSPNGTVVGTLATVDPDPGDTFTYTLLVNAGGRFALVGNQVVVANSALLDFETNSTHTIQVRSADPANQTFTKNLTITVVNQNEVVNRRIFYNNSKFDGNSTAANAADDAAIATDKTALRPGGSATFANYSSYSRGINGVIFDVEHLAGSPTVADLQLRVGNDNNPAGWVAAPAPTSLLIRTGAGVGGSDRVELTWADGAIKKTWLQVTVKATAATGLPADDVFYFGNAVGESGDAPNAIVNSTDEVQARLNSRTFLNPALVDNIFDYNRDGLVNATDQIVARGNSTIAATALKWITVPASLSGMSESASQLVSAAAAPSGEPLALADLALATQAAAISDDSQSTTPSLASSARQGASVQATGAGSVLLNNLAAPAASAPPSAQANAASGLDLSARAHLSSRARAIDAVVSTPGPSSDAPLAIDWMARVGQFRRRTR